MNASAPLRAVLDANVLTRFLLSPEGFSGRLYRAIGLGECLPVTSETILAEVADVMRRPHVRKRVRLSDEELDGLLDAYRAAALVVPGRYEVFVVHTDPDDNPILACALEGRADYVVTDDRLHLLPLKHWRGIQIVSVPGFLRLLDRR